MLSPPGNATRASPVRASNGPRTAIEARIRRTSSYGASTEERCVASTATPPSSQATPAPRCSRTSPIVKQSWMRGTLRSTERPGASRVAAISLRAEFLAPEIRTEPASRAPPVTKRRSISASYRRATRRRSGRGIGQSRVAERDPGLGPRDLDLHAIVVGALGRRSQLLEAPRTAETSISALELRVRGEHVHPRGSLLRGHVEEARRPRRPSATCRPPPGSAAVRPRGGRARGRGPRGSRRRRRHRAR